MNTLQKRAVEIALSGHNLLLTGAGGTGKTFVMKHIIRNLKTSHKNVGVTASTGMASTCFAEFNATTLHRWCGLSFELENRNLEEIVQSIISRGNCENIVLANALVIDEISMISAKTFDLFEYICRKIRKNPNYFGGLQVLLSGSFTQLPPVANGRNQDNGQYCFESDIFKNSIPHHVHLTEMLRQKDHQLATLVQELETGCPSPKSEDLLRTLNRPLVAPPNEKISVLMGTNFAVDCHNQEMLHEAPGELKSYRAIDKGRSAALYKCPAPRILTLKVGAPVILLKNISRELVNGLQGVVHATGDAPVINFSGKLVPLTRYTFIYEGAVREQYPVKLSYAITVHRAQGQNLDYLIVNCRDFFSPGQLGVAIGRATTLGGLQVLNYSSEIGQIEHCKVLTDFLKNTHSNEILGCLSSCCAKAFPEQVQVTSDDCAKAFPEQVQVTSDDADLGDSRDEASQKVELSLEYTQVLNECKLPEHTSEQVQINKLLESLHYNAGVNTFLTHVQEKCNTAIRDMEKLAKRKTESAKTTGIMDALSFYTQSLTEPDFERECKNLMGENMKPAARKLCSQIAIKYFNLCVSKRAAIVRDELAEQETLNPSEELPDVLPDKLRSQLRYIGGATIAKIKWRHNNKIKASLGKTTDFTGIKIQQAMFDIVTVKEAIITEKCRDKASLEETLERQNANKSLTHISDECYDFFVHLYRDTYRLDTEEKIFMKNISLQRISHVLSANNDLCQMWFNLFADLSFVESEEQEALLDALILQIFEEVCEHFTKIYNNDFLSKAKSEMIEKKQSLRASLKAIKRKKVNDDATEADIKKRGSTTCGICDLVCVDDPCDVGEQSIGCDSCESWFHWHCVGVTEKDDCVMRENMKWQCPACIPSRKSSGRGRGKGRGKRGGKSSKK